MTGGNQLKLSAVICGTPFGDADRPAPTPRGAVVGGTSAGASIQSSHMVAFGAGGATPKQRMTQVAAGLGLLDTTRDRPALRPAQPLRPAADDRRPVAAAARASASTRTPARPSTDEDGHEVLRVVGRGAVTIFDPARRGHERLRGQALLAAAGQRRRAARAAGRRGVRPDRAGRWSRTRPVVGPPRTPRSSPRRRPTCAAGPRHRRRRRLPGAPAPAPGPQARAADGRDARPTADHEQDGAPGDRTPDPRPRRSSRPASTAAPNVWSYDKAIHLVVDLGVARGLPDQHAPGLHRPPARAAARPARALLLARPRAAASSSGSTRAPGSGHVAEHVALALQQVVGHDIRRGKTRQVKGEHGPLQRHLRVRRRAGRPRRRPARRPPGQPPGPGRPGVRLGQPSSRRFILRAERTAFGPSTQAILDEAVSRDIPWIRLNQHSLVQLGQGVHQKRIRATMTSETSVDRRRHRLRQGPHHPAARRGRPAGAQAGVGAHRRPGGRAWPAGSATRSWSSRSTATTAAASASTCRTTTTCARRSRSPRSSPGAAACIVESFVTGKDYRCLIIDGRMAAIAERVPAHVIGDGTQHRRASWSTLTNADPRRGVGHEKVLTRIKVDDAAVELVARPGLRARRRAARRARWSSSR